jgi:hypothetical protein
MKRKFNILGARQANLNKEYVERLEKHNTYVAPPHMLRMRSMRPDPASLPALTVEDVAKHKDDADGIWVSCLGYVVKPTSIWFKSHRGRDLTTRMLMQFHGIPMDDNDDR